MTYDIDTKSKRRLSAELLTGLAISAALVLGTFAASAAEDRRGDDHRGGDHRGGGWHGGYYPAPPVVYGSPYYAPPVVYGPGVGVFLPGINIRVR